MISRAFSSRLACALLASTAITAAAQAQSVPDIPAPPVRQSVDANGINLATGKVNPTDEILSIGQGRSGLSFYRYWATPGGWNHSYRYAIYDNGASGVTVVNGSRSLIFSSAGGVFTNTAGTGPPCVFESTST